MKKALLFILMLLWQLPQAIVGFIIYIHMFSNAQLVERSKGVIWVFNTRFYSGISLWPFIILKRDKPVDRAHEYGHTIQSRRWGWLYLPVVGLASVVHLWFRDNGWIWDRKSDYYAVWPENKADELGGVKRDGEGRRYVD